MSDKRMVRFDGVEEGPFGLQQIMRMRTRGDLGAETEFWSERDKTWKPIVAMMTDFEVYDDERLREMREAGILYVTFAGNDEDCPACQAFMNKVFPIDEAPTLPPAECTCVPWCRLILIATPAK